MKLLIVESPSKAKTINNYLGKDYKVVSSYGHIRSLPSQNGSVVPDEDFKMIYEVIDRSKKNVDQIVKLAKDADEVLLATDPDREGEAISWHISEVLKSKKAVKGKMRRVVFHEITKKAVTDAITHPRDLDSNLVHAQQSRQALDYLVGFTLSPVLWRKLPGSRSAGRVQSVALRIICDREGEIEKFKTDEYWSITGDFKSHKDIFQASLSHFDSKKLDKLSIKDAKQASSVVSEVEKHKYTVTDVEKRQIRKNPHAPFTTSTMLQEAARKLGYSAKKTSKLAQDLYEGANIAGDVTGLITYMRTDSVYVSAEALEASRNFINKEYGEKYLPKSARIFKTKTKNAQEAHEAIRPTNFKFTPEAVKKYLEPDHFKLYELIWKRMIASQMEPAVLDNVSADIKSENGKIIFGATGSTLNFDGHYRLYGHRYDDEETQKLPKLEVGQKVDLEKILPKQHFTQPPPRYTEASLVKKMEELGIGRPSTYPAIISVLQEREYVKMEKKRFFPESKGRIVSAFLEKFFTQYVEYDFTANLEEELDEVSNGKLDWKKMLKAFWSPFKKRTDEVLEIKNVDIVKNIEEQLESLIYGTDENRKCPTCKTGTLGLKTGKFGAFVGCSNYPECKHTKQLVAASSESDGDSEGQTSGFVFPKVLGQDKEGKEVSIRKGPYGIYIQVGDGKEVKRISLPRGKSPELIELPYALDLAKLPRILGEHPDTGEKVRAGIGRFGPYIEHQKKFKSLKADDPTTISLERALEILAQPTAPRGRRKS